MSFFRPKYTRWRVSYAYSGKVIGSGRCDLSCAKPMAWPLSGADWDLLQVAARKVCWEGTSCEPDTFAMYSAQPMETTP